MEEKSADEMFAETRYYRKTEIISKNEIEKILYERNTIDYIKFDIENKDLIISGNITTQELQAINKKVKELGWYE